MSSQHWPDSLRPSRYRVPPLNTCTAIEYVRIGDQGARFIFKFCPICGTTVYHSEFGDAESVSVAVEAFADPAFPAPRVAVYDSRRHSGILLSPDMHRVDNDPT